MPFFSKSRSSAVSAASSMSSGSSASLLIPQDKKSQRVSSDKDYSAAFGALSSQYGLSSSVAPAFNITLSKGSKPQPQPVSSSSSNVKKVRAKEFGAVSNKYGAIGYGGMSSIV